MDIPTELQQVGISDALRAALDAAVSLGESGRITHGPSKGRLRTLGLVAADGSVTEAGRRQVRWYNDDVGLLWGVAPDTINSYVGTTSIPPEDGRAIVGRHVRRWWRPATILEFERPGMGGPTGPRVEIDIHQVIRQFRAGASVRALARMHGVSAATINSRLVDAGEIMVATTEGATS